MDSARTATSKSRPAPAAPKPRTGPRMLERMYSALRRTRRALSAKLTERNRGRRRRHQGLHHLCSGRLGLRHAPHRDRHSTSSRAQEPLRRRTPAVTRPLPLSTCTPKSTTRSRSTINPADLRVDVYRASGAGGQHVQKTESAVRITHIPDRRRDGLPGRPQHSIRTTANKPCSQLQRQALRARDCASARAEQAEARGQRRSDIGWGHQIRSYVLDQSRIKDLRTNVEDANTTAVLNGDLDQFIEASLKQGV